VINKAFNDNKMCVMQNLFVFALLLLCRCGIFHTLFRNDRAVLRLCQNLKCVCS